MDKGDGCSKMKHRSYNLNDYAALYKSLVHLYGMPNQKAAKLTYDLSTAISDTAWYHRHIDLPSYDPERFLSEIRRCGKPMPTFAALSRALDDMLECINPLALVAEQKMAVRHAHAVADSLVDKLEEQPSIPVHEGIVDLCVGM